MKRTRIPLIAVALCAITASPAHAAFFPELSVGLDPATASKSPRVTATITQPTADTPIERFTLSFPAGFRSTGATGATACPVEEIRTGSCSTASRIGTVDGRVAGVVAFSGTIHKTGTDQFALLISVLGGEITQLVPGTVVTRPNGSFDLKVDQLPGLPVTDLTFRFDGGRRSLVGTPAACGQYDVDGKFTSRLGELALDRTLVAITGCSGVPAVQVANLRMSRRSFTAGGYRTIIAWWASRATDHTVIRIERRSGGKWRLLGKLVADGLQGENAVRWDGRVRSRTLRPGRYGVRIQPAGSAPSKLLPFRITRG